MNKYETKNIYDCDSNGIITSADVTKLGLHRSKIQNLVRNGEYYQAARGIYVRSDAWEDEFYILQKKYQCGIFSHATALYLHGYCDRVPLSFHLTFPQGYNAQSLKKENVIITRVNKENYELGVVNLTTPAGNLVKAYDLERCLCDILRGKGDDIQIIQTAMKKYAISKEHNINLLMKYAKQLRVEEKVRRYMEVLL